MESLTVAPVPAEHIDVSKCIAELEKLDATMFNGDWLRTWDLSDEQLRSTLLVAQCLKQLYRENVDCRCFNAGLAVSEFRDNSTRTRFSFAKAASLLGLNVQDMDEQRSQKAHGETTMETANMISFLTEVLGIRDDKFIGEGHEYQKEVSSSVQLGFEEGCLPQRPCVVNLQCDEDHPTQSTSDLLHMARCAGGLEKLRGKRIAMTWAYSPSYGKPLSVPQGIITICSRFGMNIELAYPEGYELLDDTIKVAEEQSRASGGSFHISHNMEEAVKGADFVYCKSWCPYSVMKQRTELLRSGEKPNGEAMAALERAALAENARHKDWVLTSSMFRLAAPTAQYMHCLPADIAGLNCENGEITNELWQLVRRGTYLEAENKPYCIAAMIIMCRFPKAVDVIKAIIARNEKRRIL